MKRGKKASPQRAKTSRRTAASKRRPARPSAKAAATSAPDLRRELNEARDQLRESLEQQTATSEVLRIISSSPGELQPVAGVIGTHKFVYDVWGDTVNTASRMESQSLPGRIQISAATRAALGNRFRLERRGIIEVKGKGTMETYFLSDP